MAAANSSAIGSSTMNRLAAMQLWPELRVRAVAAAAAARSTSASARTMNGSEPPSSSTVFLSWRPASPATSSPAASLPVRVTAATRGSAISRGTMRLGTSRVVNDPLGSPACRKTSSMASAQPGTFEACLSSPTLPAISAGAAKRNTCQNGKFHGITASTAPIGS